MLTYVDVLQVYTPGAALPGQRAVRFAAGIAADLGAQLFLKGSAPTGSGHGFYDRSETVVDTHATEWAAAEAPPDRIRVVLTTGAEKESQVWSRGNGNCVFIELAPWHSEDTLFTASGLGELLGEPDREPLVPAANYASHTLGYAAFEALVAVVLRMRRFAQSDFARVDGVGAVTWTNWKTVNVTAASGEPLVRQGSNSMWPILECKDGGFAFLFREQDWPGIVEMIGVAALENEQYATARGLMAHRDEVMEIIGTWCKGQSVEHIAAEFEARGIPGAPLVSVAGLMQDRLLLHRGALWQSGSRLLPVLPHRIVREVPAIAAGRSLQASGTLPLSGIRVLDMGIIGAGAGTSGLLADLGADVIKVEAPNRPDPFRFDGIVPGSQDRDSALLFKSKNRNKRAISLDLKSEEDLRTFYELARSADIVLENFRRGVIERLGVTLDRLREANPCIVLASISGQGNDGPGVRHATFGSTLESNGGMGWLTQYDDGAAYLSGPNLNFPDQTINLLGSAFLAACVFDCRDRGVAVHLDISQRDCSIYQIGDVLGFVSGGGSDDVATLRKAAGRPALSGVFPCADRRHVAVGINSHAVVDGIDGLKSATPEQFAAWARERSSELVIDAVLAAGGGAVRSPDGHDLLGDETLFRRQVFTHSPDGTLVQGFPFQLRDEALRIAYDSPQLGEHTQEVLRELLP